MKNKLLLSGLLGMISTIASNAFAQDSRWLLCKNDRLALNIFEHRAADGQHRDTSLALIHGGYVLLGEVPNHLSGNVALVRLGDPKTTYWGQINIDFPNDKVTLTGTLKLNNVPYNAGNTVLQCSELGNGAVL